MVHDCLAMAAETCVHNTISPLRHSCAVTSSRRKAAFLAFCGQHPAAGRRARLDQSLDDRSDVNPVVITTCPLHQYFVVLTIQLYGRQPAFVFRTGSSVEVVYKEVRDLVQY